MSTTFLFRCKSCDREVQRYAFRVYKSNYLCEDCSRKIPFDGESLPNKEVGGK